MRPVAKMYLILSLMKEWKRCDDKQGYRTCFTKYNQGNDDDVG